MTATVTSTAIVLDIEGTTTPIAFVHDVLFPYARSHLAGYLASHASEVPDLIVTFRADYDAEPERPTTFELEPYIHWLADRDRKSTALKALQGNIWRAGYESDELRATVFDDVPGAMRAWRDEGILIAIYSSGSIAAQQLLFRHTNHGDLTGLIASYFDTTTGPKRSASSYEKIRQMLDARTVYFVSDIVEELHAARDADIRGVLAVRPGNAAVAGHSFPSITRFDQLVLTSGQ